VIGVTSLSGLVQSIVDLENALRGRQPRAGGGLRRLEWLARHAGLQDKGKLRTCKTVEKTIGGLEFTA
jgi:hypothetical protein